MGTRISSPRLDFRTVFVTPLRLFVPWLGSVLLATWAGYPGVVCITPMAWLLALAVGLSIETSSPSQRPAQRLTEATLGGAFIGFLQGILFITIAPRMGAVAPDELTSAVGISLGMLCVGIPVAAGLSALTAWIRQRRPSVT